MSNLLLQKIVLLRVTEVGKIILKKKRPLLLARSVASLDQNESSPRAMVIYKYFYVILHAIWPIIGHISHIKPPKARETQGKDLKHSSDDLDE